MDLISSKIQSSLAQIIYDEVNLEYSAVLGCPYCVQTITVLRNSIEWDISNFETHLTEAHNRGKDKRSTTLTYDLVN